MSVLCLFQGEMAAGRIMGRKQGSGGSVMFWAMIFWETMGSGIHVDVTLTCTVPPTFVEHVIVADGNGVQA